MDRNVVSLPLIRLVFNQMLDALEERRGEQIELVHSHYWSIPGLVGTDPYRRPGTSDLTLGEVAETYANLVESVAHDESGFSYGFVWLADLLRLVGIQESS